MQNALFDFLEQYMPLTTKEKEFIASCDNFRAIKKGTVLLSEGQYSQEEYFVMKGCLRTYYVIEGEEKTTAFYTEMEGISPNCVFNHTPSEYYISAVEDSIITVAVSGEDIDISEKYPRFEKLCRVISENLLSKNRLTLDSFKISSPEQRYLNVMETRPDLIQRIPQHQLASFLGITPQSLSRIRARISKNKK